MRTPKARSCTNLRNRRSRHSYKFSVPPTPEATRRESSSPPLSPPPVLRSPPPKALTRKSPPECQRFYRGIRGSVSEAWPESSPQLRRSRFSRRSPARPTPRPRSPRRGHVVAPNIPTRDLPAMSREPPQTPGWEHRLPDPRMTTPGSRSSCDPKGSMAFLQNQFWCPPMLGARRT